MTLPRRVLPGRPVMVTRRCAQRKLFLRPDAVVEQVVTYCLALAAERHGVEVFCLVVLSNHIHLGLVDRRGELPRFAALFNGLVARAMNVKLRRGENFWSPGSYSAVTLGDPDAVLDKIVYMTCNPVEAGLVESPEAWPGLITTPGDLCRRELVADRPSFFFRQPRDDAGGEDEGGSAAGRARRRRPPRGLLPERVRLRLVRPPGLDDLDDDAVRALVSERVSAKVAEIHARREAEGLGPFLGREAVLLQDPEGVPGPSKPGFGLNPRVACRDRWRRAELLEDLVEFWRAHQEAAARFRAGERGVHFPAGTYGYRVLFGVRCRPASLAA
ncbi:MAG: hypothetical protein KF878_07335 [Planctomycetes bacterium]|nr:hypothetical protein [Planctomycetota bacterium]